MIMKRDLNALQEIELDILREVGNIGAGHAATALSTLIQKTIDMEVPKVNIVSFADIGELLGGEEQIMVSVFLRVEGDAPGNLLFMLTLDSAKELVEQIVYSEESNSDEFNDMEYSALKEIGNILAGSYLSSLADFTNLTLLPTVPAVTIDMVGAILGFGLIQVSQVSDVAIVIDTTFLEGDRKVEGHFFLIPDPDSFDILFNALGVNW